MIPPFLLKIIIYVLKPDFLFLAGYISGGIILFLLLLLLINYLLRRKIDVFSLYGEPWFIFYRIVAFIARKKWFFLIPTCIIFLATISGIILPNPKVTYPTSPAFGITDVTDKNPLRITFDRPFDKKSIQLITNPKIDGHFVIAKGKHWPLKNTILFYPHTTLAEESTFTVSIKNIASLVRKNSKEFLFSFKTPPAPAISQIQPADKSGNVDINQPIIVTLNRPDDNKNNWQFKLDPETAISVSHNKNTYTIKPNSPLKKGISYTLTVSRAPISYNYKTHKSTIAGETLQVATSTFTTVASPTIESSSPSGTGVLINSTIRLKFRQAMDQSSVEKAFSINPQITGKFGWSNNELTFTPSNPLQKNTTYTISLAPTAASSYNTTFDNSYSFNFTTIGYVAPTKFNPSNAAKNINLNQAISITFNQKVDHASAESKFSINPSIPGTFSWSENTMAFNHGNLDYAKTYTITISSGVKSINGLDSNQNFSASFTTKQQSITLNVPAYRQSHMYSCYASAARSALAFKGIKASEDTILNKIGYDTTPWSGSWNQPGSTWGDPDKGIVGNVNGKANNIGWGYGVYWGPVASAINSLGRTADTKTGWNVQGLASEIAAGNPVIIWWVNGVWPAYELLWYNNGNRIRAVNSLHVQTVKGFTGSVDNPTSFTVTDSGYGYPGKTFDVGTFKAKWSWFNNSAIVVH